VKSNFLSTTFWFIEHFDKVVKEISKIIHILKKLL